MIYINRVFVVGRGPPITHNEKIVKYKTKYKNNLKE